MLIQWNENIPERTLNRGRWNFYRANWEKFSESVISHIPYVDGTEKEK